jgi:hypothetical protein
MSCPHRGKENPLAKTTLSRMRHLTAIRGSDSLSVAKQDEGFRDGDVSGAFFFCRYGSFGVFRVRGSRNFTAFERRVDFWELIDEIGTEIWVVPIIDRKSDLVLGTLDARDLLAVVALDNVRCWSLRPAYQGLQDAPEPSIARQGWESRV